METMLEEVKKALMMMMSHQIENIGKEIGSCKRDSNGNSKVQ